jgi:hypothetical protein
MSVNLDVLIQGLRGRNWCPAFFWLNDTFKSCRFNGCLQLCRKCDVCATLHDCTRTAD